MQKKRIMSYIEQCSFLLFLLIGTTNKLWFKEEYLRTVSWGFLCVYLIAANRHDKSPLWIYVINIVLGIGCIIILISDIISIL